MTDRKWTWDWEALWKWEADFMEGLIREGKVPATLEVLPERLAEWARDPPHAAKTATVLRWMLAGNYKPLAAAIRSRETDFACLELLAEQIEQGRVVLKWGKRGRPKDPEAIIRSIVAARTYERNDMDFAELAAALGMSEKAVQAAVTDYRRKARRPR
jgi:hypothetical protein